MFFAGARPLKESTADSGLEDNSRWLVLELACVSNNGMSRDRPPHAEIGGEVAESLFWRVMEFFMAGGNYPVAGVPLPDRFAAAVDAEIAAAK
jgi:hypothetical protein